MINYENKFNLITSENSRNWCTLEEKIILIERMKKDYFPFLIVESTFSHNKVLNRHLKSGMNSYNKAHDSNEVLRVINVNGTMYNRTIYLCKKSAANYLRFNCIRKLPKNATQNGTAGNACIYEVLPNLTLKTLIPYSRKIEEGSLDTSVFHNPELVTTYCHSLPENIENLLKTNINTPEEAKILKYYFLENEPMMQRETNSVKNQEAKIYFKKQPNPKYHYSSQETYRHRLPIEERVKIDELEFKITQYLLEKERREASKAQQKH